ncbi:MAG TPA: N-acetylmuramoyl-L-alanine amidase [Terriglobales bacterium]|nr:N-acetylmuramoyl-L-alanine amidase [Terriglobales bacterium]
MLVLRRLFLLLLLLVPVSAMAKPAVTDARVGTDGDTTRIELQLSGTPQFRSFYLPDPDRIVVDLDEVDWKVAAGHKLQGTGLVTDLRYGLFKAGTSRVVIDLQQPAAIASIGQQQSTLVIDLRPVSAADFTTAVRTGTAPATVATASGQATPTVPVAAADPAQTVPSDTTTASPSSAKAQSSAKGLGKNSEKPIAAQPQPAADKLASAVSKDADKDGTSGQVALTAPTVSKQVSSTKTAKTPVEKPMIVIDAGHGGVDPGALGDGVMEKNITLAVALALKKELLSTGHYRVKLTRETDVYIPLRDRFKVARDNGADLFISLHADSHNDPFMRGASVYTLSETASDAEAADLANQENKSDIIAGVDLSKQSGMVTDILIDLAQRDTINQSNTFAVDLVSELKSDTLMLEHSHRSAGFAVLKAPDVPSVLIEMGYISSNKDQALLTDKPHQARLAKSIRRAIDDYFANREPVRRS